MVAVRHMDQTDSGHQPVMLAEAISCLRIQPSGIYVDATFGRGGHSAAILEILGPEGRLFAIDRDPEAIAAGRARFVSDSRFVLWHGAFSDVGTLIERQGLTGRINGILFDLGVSSPQLDSPGRGFSFMREGALDMRMDNSSGVDAATWLKTVSEEELSKVLWRYGEEKFARRIARAIVASREATPILTTTDLVNRITAAMPKWTPGKHPATRTFQAIRMAVNAETDELESGLKQALRVLAPLGRLVVISFHSLEDRIVKQFMRHEEKGDIPPRGLPIKAHATPRHFRCVGRALMPSAEEVTSNPRSRSAVMRVGEKLS